MQIDRLKLATNETKDEAHKKLIGCQSDDENCIWQAAKQTKSWKEQEEKGGRKTVGDLHWLARTGSDGICQSPSAYIHSMYM